MGGAAVFIRPVRALHTFLAPFARQSPAEACCCAQSPAVGPAARLPCGARPPAARHKTHCAPLRALRSDKRRESFHEARFARRPAAYAPRRLPFAPQPASAGLCIGRRLVRRVSTPRRSCWTQICLGVESTYLCPSRAVIEPPLTVTSGRTTSSPRIADGCAWTTPLGRPLHQHADESGICNPADAPSHPAIGVTGPSGRVV